MVLLIESEHCPYTYLILQERIATGSMKSMFSYHGYLYYICSTLDALSETLLTIHLVIARAEIPAARIAISVLTARSEYR